jgi:hypothetical protein
VSPLNTNVVFSAVAAAEERPPLCPVDETSRVLKYFHIFLTFKWEVIFLLNNIFQKILKKIRPWADFKKNTV